MSDRCPPWVGVSPAADLAQKHAILALLTPAERAKISRLRASDKIKPSDIDLSSTDRLMNAALFVMLHDRKDRAKARKREQKKAILRRRGRGRKGGHLP